MASKKNLKKDINYLTQEVAETCFLHLHLNQDKEEKVKEIDAMVHEVVDLRNDLMEKINKPDEDALKKSAKAYYKGIFQQMIDKVDDTFERLDKMDA